MNKGIESQEIEKFFEASQQTFLGNFLTIFFLKDRVSLCSPVGLKFKILLPQSRGLCYARVLACLASSWDCSETAVG